MNPRASIITPSDLHCMLFDEDAKPGALPLSLLLNITNNFSDELIIGSGGFAEVYKGMVENELVAVKRLTEESMDDKEYGRELECLMKVNHKNIVRFLGYCGDTQWDMRRRKGELVKSNKEQRLLCFEYVPNGSLCSYIKDPSAGLKWRDRYHIIKGICEGLYYLHEINIVHLDLKPGNILLDKNMVPRITDFGLSRYFKKDKTYVTATKEVGTMGYMAPEYSSKRITHKFDLYSLGVIIIEIMTGKKGHQAVENVLESWSNMLEISEVNTMWEQMRVCAEIGIQCIESDPAKRPSSMKHIMDRLASTESAQLILADNPSELLGVHPFALCFPFEPSKMITCSLHLTNNTNEPVAFRLMKNAESWASLARLPLYGIVPPRSLYTLVVVAQEEKELPQKRYVDLILESTRLGDEHTRTFQTQPNDSHFEEARNMGNVVQKASLKAVYTPRRETITSSKAMSPAIKIMYYTGKMYTRSLYSLDANQKKQWIIVGEDRGHLRIWNYETQRKVDSIKVSLERVRNVKFIAQKQWFVAGTDDGYIHVYSYETKMQRVTSIKFKSSSNLSLAAHPTRPYLLSSNSRRMKVWDWERGWECTQAFDKEHSKTICQVVFNTKDSIASASEDHTVKVWSLDSPKSNYTLSGHTNKVNCLDFFTCADEEYLVTGSDDCTGKIWDTQKRICVYTLEGFMSPVMSVVYQPTIQILITGSKDGLVYLWSTTNSRICSSYPRLERIIDIGCRGAVHGLACLMRGVVIGKEDSLAMMNIEQSSDDYSEPQFSANYTTRSEERTCKEITGSNRELPILDVHPLELHFLLGREGPITSPLHLTNKTDELVIFKLIDNRANHYSADMPLYGVMPPRSTYTLIMKTDMLTAPDGKTDFDLVLQSRIPGDKYIVPFADTFACRDFWGEAEELRLAVHEVPLRVIYTHTVLPQGETTSEHVILQRMQIISMNSPDRVCCLDAHSTKPWIITGHKNGTFSIWKYDSQSNPIVEVRKSWLYWSLPRPSRNLQTEGRQIIDSFKVSERTICSIKFIARKQRILAGTNDGFIHVYNCARVTHMKKITSFKAHNASVDSLAVHPIQPYVLSAADTCIKLWDMDQGWQCRQLFAANHKVAFNPHGANSFASVNLYNSAVEVWSIEATELSNTPFGDLDWMNNLDEGPVPIYTLDGHLRWVKCLDFFTRDDGRQYLITGSDDCTVKIWDLQKRECIHTTEDIISPVISVISLPGRPYLVTGSEDGVVHVWSSIDFRLQGTVHFAGGGPVRDLAYLMGSRRVVTGQERMISILNIDGEEAADSQNIWTISRQIFTTAQTETFSSYKRRFVAKVRKTFNMSRN